MAIINVIARRANSDGEWEYNESVNDTDFPTTDWVHNPDLSGVSGIDPAQWKWNGTAVVAKSPDEMAVDADDYEAFTIEGGGRVYCYPDDRWISGGDDNYSTRYYQFSESAGTNVDPIYEWEHQGHIVKSGDIIRSWDILGRANSSDLTEMELILAYRRPSLDNDFNGDVNSDGEMTTTEILREQWRTPFDTAFSGPVHGGAMTHMHRRLYERTFVVPEAGWLTPYWGPTNTNSSSNRYFMHTYRIDLLRRRR